MTEEISLGCLTVVEYIEPWDAFPEGGWAFRCVMCPYESAPYDVETDARDGARLHEAA